MYVSLLPQCTFYFKIQKFQNPKISTPHLHIPRSIRQIMQLIKEVLITNNNKDIYFSFTVHVVI